MRWPNGGARSPAATAVRRAAVAGRFYEDRPDRLAAGVDRQLAVARSALANRAVVGRKGRGKSLDVAAIVVPHAGHVYSVPVAAFAYAALDPARVSRVVLLGPSHFVALSGIGLSTADAWRTPLGDVPLDRATSAQLRARFDDVFPADEAHAPEHSLEVQLPFLQRVLGDGWTLLPLIIGADLPDELAEVIETCAALPNTLVVVSTDLSHYLDHDTARRRDDRTIAAVLARRPDAIGVHDACGRHPLRGLLTAAPALGWELDLLDARTSGDTAGSRDRVVGYAAFLAWVADGSGAESPPAEAFEAAADMGRTEHPSAGSPHAAASGERADEASKGARAPVHPAERSTAGNLPEGARTALLGLARDTIEEALATSRRPTFDVTAWAAAVPEPSLSRHGAAFVTLRGPSGALLGCIGSLSAHQPLAADVAEHAYDAAFRDQRFTPMTTERSRGMVIDISVLTEPMPLHVTSYDDLLRRLEPGVGLVVTAGRHRATFLPAVWQQIPGPVAFLAALWRKAGLGEGDWPAGIRIEMYGSEEFAEPGFPGTASKLGTNGPPD